VAVNAAPAVSVFDKHIGRPLVGAERLTSVMTVVPDPGGQHTGATVVANRQNFSTECFVREVSRCDYRKKVGLRRGAGLGDDDSVIRHEAADRVHIVGDHGPLPRRRELCQFVAATVFGSFVIEHRCSLPFFPVSASAALLGIHSRLQ
jgi:hypothetical protein